jgi:hypothetical protein
MKSVLSLISFAALAAALGKPVEFKTGMIFEDISWEGTGCPATNKLDESAGSGADGISMWRPMTVTWGPGVSNSKHSVSCKLNVGFEFPPNSQVSNITGTAIIDNKLPPGMIAQVTNYFTFGETGKTEISTEIFNSSSTEGHSAGLNLLDSKIRSKCTGKDTLHLNTIVELAVTPAYKQGTTGSLTISHQEWWFNYAKDSCETPKGAYEGSELDWEYADDVNADGNSDGSYDDSGS